jgi:hypothetical protein
VGRGDPGGEHKAGIGLIVIAPKFRNEVLRNVSMFLNLSVDDFVSLRQANDFKSFKLIIEGGPKSLEKVRAVMSSFAEIIDDKNAWISEIYLRQMPEVRSDEDWQRSLSVMIELAKPYGWVDKERKAIKAHIEWPEVDLAPE